jgi:hypothetical protein
MPRGRVKHTGEGNLAGRTEAPSAGLSLQILIFVF